MVGERSVYNPVTGERYGPGESALLPRGVWHDFWVVGDGPAVTVARAIPALGTEQILTHWAAHRPWAANALPRF